MYMCYLQPIGLVRLDRIHMLFSGSMLAPHIYRNYVLRMQERFKLRYSYPPTEFHSGL
jgi:hypothetical protein